MNFVLYGNYFQDNEYKEPIEWIPIYKYVTQNEKEPQYLLVSRNVLLAFRSVDQWEHSHVREYLNNSFFNEAFTDEEKSNLIKFRNMDTVRIPYFIEIYDKIKKNFYNKEMLNTELTAWAANGNAFTLQTTFQTRSGLYKMNPAYEQLVRLSYQPSWQVLSDSIFEHISIRCNSDMYYTSNESAFYGIRPCIKLKPSGYPDLEKITDTIPVEYVKESQNDLPAFKNTKIKIDPNPVPIGDDYTYKPSAYGPNPKKF